MENNGDQRLGAIRLRKALVLHSNRPEEYQTLVQALGGPLYVTDSVPPVNVVVAKKSSGHWIVFGPDAKGCADVTASLRASGLLVDACREDHRP